MSESWQTSKNTVVNDVPEVVNDVSEANGVSVADNDVSEADNDRSEADNDVSEAVSVVKMRLWRGKDASVAWQRCVCGVAKMRL